MKLSKLFATIALTLSFAAPAFAERRAPYAKLDAIDWNDPATLDQSFLSMCDDSYYSGLKVIVPGRLGKEFKITLDTNSGWLVSNIRRVDKGSVKQSEITVENGDTSGEEMIIQQILPDGTPGKTATILLHDAC